MRSEDFVAARQILGFTIPGLLELPTSREIFTGGPILLLLQALVKDLDGLQILICLDEV